MHNRKEALPQKLLTSISEFLYSKIHKEKSPLSIEMIYYIRNSIDYIPVLFLRRTKPFFQIFSLGYVFNKNYARHGLPGDRINKTRQFQVKCPIFMDNGLFFVFRVLF